MFCMSKGTWDYIAASWRVIDVAEYTARLLDFMNYKKLLNFNTLHIVGHSLGFVECENVGEALNAFFRFAARIWLD